MINRFHILLLVQLVDPLPDFFYHSDNDMQLVALVYAATLQRCSWLESNV